MTESDANGDLVPVFHAEEPELVPLAEAALEEQQIPYAIRPSTAAKVQGVFGHPAEFGGAEGPVDIFVAPGDAARAGALLADLALEASAPTVPIVRAGAPGTDPPAADELREYRLIDASTGTPIAEISARQLRVLVDELEEETDDDQDYYIDGATLDMIEADGGDASLVATLRRALGDRDGMEVMWAKK